MVGDSSRREGGARAVDGPTVRDWLAAVNDGVPANAIVVRLAIGFEIPKDAGSLLILMGVPMSWLLLQTVAAHS